MDDQRIALSHYLMDKAYHCLLAAKGNVRDEEYTSAANRSYYAIFHSMRGILALDGVDYRKHSQVIGHFRREYIKTQIFDVKYSDVIGEAFAVRGDSDYEDFYVISQTHPPDWSGGRRYPRRVQKDRRALPGGA